MTLAKTCAAIVALALFLQSGCDLWCQHAQQTASAKESHEDAVPPCHHSGDGKSHPKESRNQPHENCTHPQAVNDNSKSEAKISKVDQPAVLIHVAVLHWHIEFHHAVVGTTPLSRLGPSGSPSAILRI